MIFKGFSVGKIILMNGENMWSYTIFRYLLPCDSGDVAMSCIISDIIHSVLQQDHSSGRDPYYRHKAWLEEGHKDNLPRERE